jgi:serine/threonine protein kinase
MLFNNLTYKYKLLHLVVYNFPSGECYYFKFQIGEGTYSNVYKARDLRTGKFVALKQVRFVHVDPESVQFMAREILILRKLNHPNIIKLEGIIASSVSRSLYLLFEYMEHDLVGLATTPSLKLTEPQVDIIRLLVHLICGMILMVSHESRSNALIATDT